VAYVIGALEEVYREIATLDAGVADIVPNLSKINKAIVVGLDYLHSTSFRTSDGMWHYKFTDDLSRKRVMENLYQYTADVLAQTSASCIRLNMYLEETKAVANRLRRIYKAYKGGMPQSPSHNTPHLETTATLIEALWQLREAMELVEHEFFSAYELAHRRDVFEVSAAGGWASFLMLSRHPFGEKVRIPFSRVEELWSTASELMLGDARTVSIPILPQASESFIRRLLMRRQARQPA
jgi:hypothetical protein